MNAAATGTSFDWDDDVGNVIGLTACVSEAAQPTQETRIMMPQQPAGVKWKRSHDCGQAKPTNTQGPTSANACYARPPRRRSRQRGDNIKAKPASAHNVATSSRQRDPPGCHEAGHDGTDKPSGFATTLRKATKRNLTVNRERVGIARCPGIPMVRGDGPRKSKPGGPEHTRRSATIRKDPANSQSSATHPDAMKREPTVSNDVSMMERCNASGRNQTRITHPRLLQIPL